MYKIFIYDKKNHSIVTKKVQKKLLYGCAFKVGDSLVVNDQNKYLAILKDTTLITIPETIELINNGYTDICEYSSTEIIILTSYNGIHKFNKTTKELIEIPISEELRLFFKTKLAESVVKIDSSRLAIATVKGGIVIIDINGNYINTINNSKGLSTSRVYKIFYDGISLWAAGENGITRIDINYPILNYSKEQGVAAYTLGISFINNILYVATMNACYFFKPNKLNQKNHLLNNVENISSNWRFSEINGNLLTIGKTGISQIIDTTATIVYRPNSPIFSFFYDTHYSDKIFIGKQNSFEIVKINKNKQGELVELEKYIELDNNSVKASIYEITSDENNNLWLSTYYNGIIYVKFLNDSLTKYEIVKFGEKNKLPSLNMNKAVLFNNEIRILTAKGIYKPIFPADSQHDSLCVFVHDDDFAKACNKDSSLVSNLLKLNENSYIVLGSPPGILTFHNDSIEWNTSIFSRITNLSEVNLISNKYLAITSSKNFYIVDLENKRNYKNNFSVLIREIMLNNDSVIFNGNFTETIDDQNFVVSTQPKSYSPVFKYIDNSITINYAANFFEEHEKTEYSYKLIGYKEKWSEYSTETKAIFTNLHEGKYKFAVKAKNIYKHSSEIAYFEFSILPPWYRTWWAYSGYIMLLGVFVFIIVKLALRRVVKAKIKLEGIVKERTAEITQQKEEIQAQADNLTEVNEELQMQKEEIHAQTEELKITNHELEKLSIVASEIDNAVFIFDKKYNLEWANEAFTKIYGCLLEEYVKNKKINLIKNSNVAGIEKIINNCISEKKSVTYEAKNQKKTGEEIWEQTTLTPIFENNQFAKIIAIESDITEIKKANNKINKANIEISFQNTQIKSSINYAKTIQQAILPIEESISENLNNFIIYRPKDVVSGDFYWFSVVKDIPLLKEVEYLKFIAAMDCTGHGVPGAFMSMIANTLLNDIINKDKIYSPKTKTPP